MNKHMMQNRFMRKRALILIATLLSLGVASSAFAYYRHHDGHGNDFSKRIERKLTQKLELNETQKTELRQLTASLMASRQSFRKQRIFDLDKIFPLLESDKLDQESMLKMVRERLAMVESHAQEVIASVSGFTDSLTREQRAELKEIIEKHPSNRRRHHNQHRNHMFD